MSVFSKILMIALLIVAFQTDAAKTAERMKYNFNPGWKILVGDPSGAEETDSDDSKWQSVTLPHAWNKDEAFKVDIHHLSTCIAWYINHFKVPAAHKGKKIFLEFEGIRQAGEFYINGIFIGRHENGVMASGFDVTDFINPYPQENVIAVRTDNDWQYREKLHNNPFQWNNGNFNANYGGIPKNVWLHVTNKLYQTLPLLSTPGTEGVYIYAQDINIPDHTAKITAEAQVRNEYDTARVFEFDVIIEDMQGTTVKTINGGKALLSPGGMTLVKDSAREVYENVNPNKDRNLKYA